MNIKEIEGHLQNIFYENIIEKSIPDKNGTPDVALDINFPHCDPVRIFSYDTIFPLKEVSFEGLSFLQVNNPELFLEGKFGKNYMDYPNTMSLGHISGQIVTKKEQKLMDELIKTLYD